MTSSLAAALLGEQRPRVSSGPAGLEGAGEEAGDLADLAGLHLDPWQRHVLDVSLRERADGRWAASSVGLVVARQNGKGAVLEARELFGLFVLGERIVHTAHLFKTASDAFRRVAGLIEATPSLKSRVKRISASHGEEEITLHSGARLQFLARTKGSGRGLSGDVLIVDEAYAANDDHLAALTPVLTTSPNPQTIYTSSAALADSEVLLRVRDAGRASSPRLAYLEWSADPMLPPDDRSGWAQANPGLGLRVSEEYLADQFALMSPAVFRREHLGAWPEDARSEWVIPPETWHGASDARSRIVSGHAFAVDVPWSRARAVIAVAGEREDGRSHVEVVDRRAGLGWVVDRLRELEDRWQTGLPVALDAGGPAGALIPDLEAMGLEVLRVGGRELAAACGGLHDRTVGDRLRHLGQSELTAALDGARRKHVGDAGAYVWDRRDPDADISPLVAATVALHCHALHAADDEGGWVMSL